MGWLGKRLGKLGQQRSSLLLLIRKLSDLRKGHYVLKCRSCDFTHHVPHGFSDKDITFSVNHGNAKLTCVYEGHFTSSLAVGEFFSLTPRCSLEELADEAGPSGTEARFLLKMRGLVGKLAHADSYLVPSSRETLHAEIAANMKVLHPHMLSHSDPLFLVIRQTPMSTEHEYKRTQPDSPAVPYVRYSRDHGTDFVGHEKVNIKKAEVPGVSWKI